MSTVFPKQLKVPLSKLRVLSEVQSRAAIDPGTVTEYIESLRAGDTLPPVTVVENGDEFIVADGNHRVNAHLACNPNGEIDASVCSAFDGLSALESAIYISCISNLTHGLKRTKADKVNAVRLYLSLSFNVNKSDRAIAEELKVHHTHVSEGRALWEKEKTTEQICAHKNSQQSGESTAQVCAVENGQVEDSTSADSIRQIEEPKKRIGKDGKARTVKPREPKSPRKPDKKPPANVSEQSQAFLSRVLNGDNDGRKADHYIEIIPNYVKLVAELSDILDRLPGLIVTADQQQAAQTAVQSIIESCNLCQQAARTFMQQRLGTSVWESSSIPDDTEPK